ncbi:MAG: DUF1947 domain-containing protein [Candidatus Thermoplasmatota archaeon]|nr:DUF1947 domain-containing protein [Candidatus Thermoplasmatota archaeon]MCL5438283.1 DUF1947 domain-containing protein [Candidatus Thermoplasmatota archaeon]
MSRHFLSRRDLSELVLKLQDFKIAIGDGKVEVDEKKSATHYYIDGRPLAFEQDNYLFPTLKVINQFRPGGNEITVDDGAVPRLMNGANLFAQGIVTMDMEIIKGSMVFIQNLKGVFFAIGIATRDAKDIMANKQGESARIVHHAGDRIYHEFG